jgi:hypothetical protein
MAIEPKQGLIIVPAMRVIIEMPTFADMREASAFIDATWRKPAYDAAGPVGEPLFGTQSCLLVQRRDKFVSMASVAARKFIGTGEFNSHGIERHGFAP